MKTNRLIVLDGTYGEIIVDVDHVISITKSTVEGRSSRLILTGLNSMGANYIDVSETPTEVVRKIKEVERGRKSPAVYLTSNLQLERELVQVLAEELYETKKS